MKRRVNIWWTNRLLLVDVKLFTYIFQDLLKSNLLSKLGSGFDPNDEHAIENNLLKMDIFYKEFNFQDIKEVPAYPVRVWSIIFRFFVSTTFVEFLEFLVAKIEQESRAVAKSSEMYRVLAYTEFDSIVIYIHSIDANVKL